MSSQFRLFGHFNTLILQQPLVCTDSKNWLTYLKSRPEVIYTQLLNKRSCLCWLCFFFLLITCLCLNTALMGTTYVKEYKINLKRSHAINDVRSGHTWMRGETLRYLNSFHYVGVPGCRRHRIQTLCVRVRVCPLSSSSFYIPRDSQSCSHTDRPNSDQGTEDTRRNQPHRSFQFDYRRGSRARAEGGLAVPGPGRCETVQVTPPRASKMPHGSSARHATPTEMNPG